MLLLHHPTKNQLSALRGSSVWSFDTDLVMELLAKNDVRTLTTPRTKEFAQITPMNFRVKVVELGRDAEGDAITSVVVDWSAPEFEEPICGLTPDQEAALDALENELDDKTIRRTGFVTRIGCPLSRWFTTRPKPKRPRVLSPDLTTWFARSKNPGT